MEINLIECKCEETTSIATYLQVLHREPDDVREIISQHHHQSEEVCLVPCLSSNIIVCIHLIIVQ